MNEKRRATKLSPMMFTLISTVLFAIVLLSLHKYLVGHDPYYPAQAIAYMLIWGVYFYIFRRSRKSQQSDSKLGAKG